MEIRGHSNVSAASQANRTADIASRTDLTAASDARIQAARNALRDAAITPAPRPQQAQFVPVQGAASQVHLAQASRSAPPAPTAIELAQMAQDVYTPGVNPPAGWSVASPAQLAQIGLTESMLESANSEFRAEVYVKNFGGQTSYTVAFRGSQSGGDWLANGLQALGLETDHYNRALELGESLVVPEGARVTLTGHSLGGGLASAASMAAELDSTTFNAAGLSRNTINAAQAIAAKDGQLDIPDISAYYVRGEVLSALQDGGDRLLGAYFAGAFGAIVADLPSAAGNRLALDPVRPDTMRWYQDNLIAKHGIDYVISSLRGI